MNYWTPYKAFTWEHPQMLQKDKQQPEVSISGEEQMREEPKRDFVNDASDVGITIGIISQMQ